MLNAVVREKFLWMKAERQNDIKYFQSSKEAPASVSIIPTDTGALNYSISSIAKTSSLTSTPLKPHSLNDNVKGSNLVRYLSNCHCPHE